MSIQAMEWAYKQDVTPAARKFVLVTLANYCDAYGIAAVDPDDLAALTGQNERSVRRHLYALEREDRLVEMVPSYREDGGRGESEIRLLSQRRSRPARSEKPTPAPKIESAPLGQIDQGPLDNSRHDPLDNLSTHTFIDLKTTNNNTDVAEESSDMTNQAYREAMTTLTDAKLLPVWRDWVRMNQMALVTQERQAIKWAAWVTAGHTEALREHAEYVMESGSYAHPHRGLESRMKGAVSGQTAQKQIKLDNDKLRDEGAEEFPAGLRLQTKDGRVLTVEVVEYGQVIFEEGVTPATLNEARKMTRMGAAS